MSPLVSYSLILSVSAAFFAWVGTWALVGLLPRLSVMDAPNERSNHAAPVPRGGGLAVIAATLFFLLVSGMTAPLFLAVALAALISFADDRKGQPIGRRLLVHIMAAVLAVSTITPPIFQGYLPYLLDHTIAALALVFFMNIFNFMDGIDEISAMQTTSLCLGVVAMVVAVPALLDFPAVDALVLAGAMAGFWYFNRHPARIFLGDVGSIPVGLLLGTLLLILASQGQWAAALILPAYYLTDAGSTLLSRLARRQKLHQAHSEHAYQQAVRRGLSHRTVVRQILTLNLLLIALAVVSSLDPWLGAACVVVAYAASGALTLLLHGVRRGAASSLSAGHA
jgi:UDP-N-acetylmuramyl pentapeptide phosphotransferase/UDP-N-acetylglucosamine-1-phosphate transferase